MIAIPTRLGPHFPLKPLLVLPVNETKSGTKPVAVVQTANLLEHPLTKLG